MILIIFKFHFNFKFRPKYVSKTPLIWTLVLNGRQDRDSKNVEGRKYTRSWTLHTVKHAILLLHVTIVL